MDYLSKLRGFLSSVKQGATDYFNRNIQPIEQSVVNTVQQAPQNIGGFANSLLNNVKQAAPSFAQNFADTYQAVSPYIPLAPKIPPPPQQIQQNWQNNINTIKNNFQSGYKWFTTPGTNPIYDSYQATQGQINVPQTNFTAQLTKNITNPYIKTAVSLPLSLGEGLINMPYQFIGSAGKLNKGIVETARDIYKTTQGQSVPTQSWVRNAANIADLPANIALMSGGAKDVLKSNTLKSKLLSGAQGGWHFGSATGALEALQNIKDTDNFSTVATNVVKEGAQKGLTMAAIGSIFGLGSFGWDRITKKPIIPDYLNNKTMAEADAIINLTKKRIDQPTLQEMANFADYQVKKYDPLKNGWNSKYEFEAYHRDLANKLGLGGERTNASLANVFRGVLDARQAGTKTGPYIAESQLAIKVPPVEGEVLKTFDPNVKLDNKLYDIFNNEYRKVQESLDIAPDLMENLPRGITGKAALKKFNMPVSEVGQEGAMNLAEKLRFEGYIPKNVVGGVKITPEQLKAKEKLPGIMFTTSKTKAEGKPSVDSFIQGLEADQQQIFNQTGQAPPKGKIKITPKENTLTGGVFTEEAKNQAKASQQYQSEINNKGPIGWVKEKINNVFNPGGNQPKDLVTVIRNHKNALDEAKVEANLGINLNDKVSLRKIGIDQNTEWKLLKWSELSGVEADRFAKNNNLTPDLLKKTEGFINQHRQFEQQIRTEAQKAGFDLGYIQNHILHKFKETPQQVEEVLSQMKGKGLGETPGFTKKRTTPPYAYVEEKLTPKYTTFGQLHADEYLQLKNALANKQLSSYLKKSGYILPDDVAPRHWRPIMSDFFPRAQGNVRYSAPPQIADYLNNIFGGTTKGPLSQGVEAAANVSGAAQDVVLSGGIKTANFFTLGQTVKDITAGLGDMLTGHPIRGTKTALAPIKGLIRDWIPGMSENFERTNKETIKEMSREGIGYGGAFNFKDVQGNVAEKWSLKKLSQGGKDVWDSYVNNPTFKRFNFQRKVDLYKNFRDHLVSTGMEYNQAVKLAVEKLKNYDGIVEQLGKNPDIQNGFKAIFMAPKYREALISSGANIIRGLKITDPKYEMSRRLGIGLLVSLFGIYDTLNQKWNNGKHMWQNQPGKEMELVFPYKDKEGNDRYWSFPWMPGTTAIYRRIAGTITGLVRGDKQEAMRQFSSLFSIPVSKGAELLTNKDYFGRDVIKEDTQNYGSKPYQYGMWALKSFSPGPVREGIQYGQDKAAYEKKIALGLKAQPPNPTVSILRAMEMPLKEGKIPSPFFQIKDQVTKNYDKDTVDAYNKLHPQKGEFEVPEPKTPQEKIKQATERAFNSNLVMMEREIGKKTAQIQGKEVDPLYTFPLETVLRYYNYERQNPGSQDGKNLLKQYPEIKKLMTARSEYFARNPLPNQTLSKRPMPSAYVQQQMDAKNWHDPQVKAYLDANTQYQNEQRALLGLTPLGGYTPRLKLASFKYKTPKLKKFAFKSAKNKIFKPTKLKSLKIKPSKILGYKGKPFKLKSNKI